MTDSKTATEPRIKQVLKEKGMSQAKLARMCDVNESSMSRIVRGIEPPYPNRGQRIAAALGWKGDWRELFKEANTPEQAIDATLGAGECESGRERSAESESMRESRWHELFGTPEKAAKVIMALRKCRVTDCADCLARGVCKCDDYDALLEWLRGKEVG